MKKLLLDTNIIIRFFVADEPDHTKAVKNLLVSAKTNSLEIPDVVLVEIVYVLLSVYKLSRESIVEKVSLLLEFEAFFVNERLLIKTLEIFSSSNVSFVDAYLCAKIKMGHNSKLYSFDKKLLKITGDLGEKPKTY